MRSFSSLLSLWNSSGYNHSQATIKAFTESDNEYLSYKYIQSKAENNKIELPIIQENSFFVQNRCSEIIDTYVLYPFIASVDDINSITTTAKLKSLIKSRVLIDKKIAVFKVHDDIYHIGKGFIIKNYNKILFFITRILDYNIKRAVGTKVYVHPEVFESSTSIINKLIIKELFPIFVQETTTIISCFSTYDNALYQDVPTDIYIKNISNIICDIKTPSVIDISNNTLNNIILDNIEDVFRV